MNDILEQPIPERIVSKYEIKCIEDVVKSKEARGEDTTFEKDLLRAYRKYKDSMARHLQRASHQP